MARPRQDGTPAREVNRRKLTDLFVSSRKAQERAELIWDVKQPGLALSVRPTGKKAWKVIYRHHGRPRWLHLGDVRKIGLADARRLAAKIMLDVIEGKDPAAERKRGAPHRHLRRSRRAVCRAARHRSTTRAGSRPSAGAPSPAAALGQAEGDPPSPAPTCAAMMVRIDAPIVANQVLAAASAIFSWAIRQEILTVNPCKLVDRNPTTDRERVLSDEEVRLLWDKLDPALKLILLTGQRPGEVAAMQREHIADGWWQMPGKPQGALAGDQERPRSPGVAIASPRRH